MSGVQLKLKGGAKLNAYLGALSTLVTSATGVRVGFLEAERYPAMPRRPSLHVAQVAFWNEFGTRTAPARPFFRGMIKADQDSWGPNFAKYLKGSGFDAKTALAALGTEIKDALTDAIQRWPGDNAPRTIAAKGFDHGLVHSGQMARATDYQVLTR